MAERQCRACRRYDPYYVKEPTRFCKAGCGWCSARLGQVQADGGCEQFEPRLSRRLDKVLYGQRLSDILAELTRLRQLAEAGYEHAEDDDL